MRPYVILLANLASHSDDNRIFKPMKFHNPVRCNYRFCFVLFCLYRFTIFPFVQPLYGLICLVVLLTWLFFGGTGFWFLFLNCKKKFSDDIFVSLSTRKKNEAIDWPI